VFQNQVKSGLTETERTGFDSFKYSKTNKLPVIIQKKNE